MKKIALLIPAIFLMPVINAQWTDNGNTITTTDNVGIGTTNPQHKMEVYGTNNAIGVGLTNYGWANTNLIGAEYGAWDNSRTNAAGTYFYRWIGSGTSYHVGYIGQEINNGHWGLAFKTNSENSKTHATSTRMFIDTDGDVGIGTTSPISKLSIKQSLENNNGGLSISDLSGRLIQIYGEGPGGRQVIRTSATGNPLAFDLNGDEKMRLNSNGNVGIGTSSPISKLSITQHLENSNGGLSISDLSGRLIQIYGEGPGGRQVIRTSATGNPLAFDLNGDEKMRLNSNGNVGIGTTSPDAKLAVNGNIHTKEVKVDLVGWPDYVFDKEYDLPSLEEVETHIAKKGHLQNIPSAKEVEANGIKLGEMNSKLLQKIEELMLYTIQQQKEIKELKSRLEKLESK